MSLLIGRSIGLLTNSNKFESISCGHFMSYYQTNASRIQMTIDLAIPCIISSQARNFRSPACRALANDDALLPLKWKPICLWIYRIRSTPLRRYLPERFRYFKHHSLIHLALIQSITRLYSRQRLLLQSHWNKDHDCMQMHLDYARHLALHDYNLSFRFSSNDYAEHEIVASRQQSPRNSMAYAHFAQAADATIWIIGNMKSMKKITAWPPNMGWMACHAGSRNRRSTCMSYDNSLHLAWGRLLV